MNTSHETLMLMTGNSESLYYKYFSVNTKFESEAILFNKSLTPTCQIGSTEL